MMRLTALVIGLLSTVASAQTPLTLSDVLEKVERENPALAAFNWELKAAEARVLQAAVRPNPELTIEVENLRLGGNPSSSTQERTLDLEFDGGLTIVPGGGAARDNGDTGVWDSTEITLSIAQAVELGGKRVKRIAHAEAAQRAVALQYELLRAETLAAAAETFIAARAAEEELKVAEALAAIVMRIEETLTLQEAAGKVAPLEVNTLRLERLMAQNEIEEFRAAEHTARLALAAFWGAAEAAPPLAGDLETLAELPPLEALQQRALAHPQVRQWAAEVAVYSELHALERANAVPDITLGAGFVSAGGERAKARGWNLSTGGLGFSRSGDTSGGRTESLEFQVSIPLPLFHRNQGAILEAEYLAEKAGREGEAATAAMQNTIAQLHAEMLIAQSSVRQLEQEIVPLAQKNFDTMRLAYEQGKNELLELMEAERALLEVQRRRLGLLATWHRVRVRLEAYLGGEMANDQQ